MTIPPRQKMIETMARLMQSQGYRNTGLNQVLAESGAPKGSLYHYFPGGKEALAIAALEHSTRLVAERMGALAASAASPRQGLIAVVEAFIFDLEQSSFQKGCPVATVTLEEAAQSPAIQQACARAFGLWLDVLAGYLNQHGIAHPEQRAESLVMALEGALILSRAQRDCAPLRRLVQSVPVMLPQEV